MKHNYTKNELLFARNFYLRISFLLQFYSTIWLTHLFLIVIPSMLKAALKKFQRPSSLFYLIVLNFIKTAIDL